MDARCSAGIVTRRLGNITMVVSGSPAYLAARGRPLTAADLKRHDIILYGRSASALPWSFRDSEGRREDVMVESRIAMDDLEAVANAAVVGAGLPSLPSW